MEKIKEIIKKYAPELASHKLVETHTFVKIAKNNLLVVNEQYIDHLKLDISNNDPDLKRTYNIETIKLQILDLEKELLNARIKSACSISESLFGPTLAKNPVERIIQDTLAVIMQRCSHMVKRNETYWNPIQTIEKSIQKDIISTSIDFELLRIVLDTEVKKIIDVYKIRLGPLSPMSLTKHTEFTTDQLRKIEEMIRTAVRTATETNDSDKSSITVTHAEREVVSPAKFDFSGE